MDCVTLRAIWDTRRDNLRLLIRERFDNVNRRLARALDLNETHLNNFFSAAQEHRRYVRENYARAIEEKLGLPPLWLDTPRTRQELEALSGEPGSVPKPVPVVAEPQLSLAGLSPLQVGALTLLQRRMLDGQFDETEVLELLAQLRPRRPLAVDS